MNATNSRRPGRGSRAASWLLFATLTAASAASAQDAQPGPVAGSSDIALPGLGGRHAVGTAVYRWVDESRKEGATADPHDFRQVRVQVWWPAEESDFPRAPYFDRPDLYEEAWRPGTELFLESVRPAAQLNAPVSDDRDAYSVLLYSHGWNSTRSGATSLMEGLAARGFIVVAVEHAYMGLVVGADGQLTQPTEAHLSGPEAPARVYGGDVDFVIEQLEGRRTAVSGRMILSNIGAIGHSSGFIAAHRVCTTDARVVACANIDSPGPSISGVVGLGKPVAVLRFDRAPELPQSGVPSDVRDLVSVLQLDDANHLSNMDWDYLQAESEADRGKALNHLLEIAEFLEAFFSEALVE